MKSRFTLLELLACRGIARRATRSRAFTLLELLVVMAIIGILASLLLTALGGARRQALQVADLSNRNQATLAIFQYAADNYYRLPHPAGDENQLIGIHSIGGSWPAAYRRLVPQLRDYIGNFAAWQCNNFPGLAPIDDPANTRGWCYSTIAYYAERPTDRLFGYGGPTILDDNPVPGKGGWFFTPRKFNDKWATSEFPLLSCATRFYRNDGVFRLCHPHSRRPGNGMIKDYPGDNPSYAYYIVGDSSSIEGAAFTFFDGHGAWVPGEELVDAGREGGQNSTQYIWAPDIRQP